MPITPTYPGIYIEELPSNARTITAAPTSVAAFVGYTHPFKTKNFNQAVQLFSFTEFEREFGGLFSSGFVDTSLAYAVNQFFLNGGSVAYVIGLQARYFDNTVPTPNSAAITPATATVDNIVFTAREPTDLVPMRVDINNRKASSGNPADPTDTADITITYGSRVETFRSVAIGPATAANFLEKVLGTAALPVSSLVTVAPSGAYAAAFAADTSTTFAVTLPFGGAIAGTFSAADFVQVFQADQPLDKVDIFNLLVIPGVADNGVWSAALAFCERKQAFCIMDPPRNAAADLASAPLPQITTLMDSIVPKSTNGAIYFPYLNSIDPLTGLTVELAPSGFVAGIYARTDTNRGVWKAPAGLETTVKNTTGVVTRGRMTDMGQGRLNMKGINALRTFPGVGTVVFGARTLVSENTALQQWRYVPVRRMALFIEQTLYRNLGWVVFEPNDEPLWISIRTSIEGFMLSLFNQGAFQGSKPSQAFLVQCDKTTTTQTDIDNGIVNIIVGFRPLKPAEFVIIKIAQLAGQVQS